MISKRLAFASKIAWFLSAICVFAGLAALAFSYSLRPDHAGGEAKGVIADVVRDLGILLSSIGTISILYEWLIRQQLLDDFSDSLRTILDPDAKRLGLVSLFRDRAERITRGESLDELIKSARSEMFCLGIGLIQFVPERQQLLMTRMREGCVFKFLIFDAACDASDLMDRSLGSGNGDLLVFIRSQTGFLRTFLKTLETQNLSNRFEVRLYSVVPTFGLIKIDLASGKQRLVVEINGNQAEGATCPGFELDGSSAGWAPFFLERARLIWEQATPLTAIS